MTRPRKMLGAPWLISNPHMYDLPLLRQMHQQILFLRLAWYLHRTPLHQVQHRATLPYSHSRLPKPQTHGLYHHKSSFHHRGHRQQPVRMTYHLLFHPKSQYHCQHSLSHHPQSNPGLTQKTGVMLVPSHSLSSKAPFPASAQKSTGTGSTTTFLSFNLT
jgi:hypothetical protein